MMKNKRRAKKPIHRKRYIPPKRVTDPKRFTDELNWQTLNFVSPIPLDLCIKVYAIEHQKPLALDALEWLIKTGDRSDKWDFLNTLALVATRHKNKQALGILRRLAQSDEQAKQVYKEVKENLAEDYCDFDESDIGGYFGSGNGILPLEQMPNNVQKQIWKDREAYQQIRRIEQ